MPPKPADGLGQLVGIVGDDPEVKAAAKRLALETIDKARFLLHNAQPAMQLQLIRSLLPTALQSLKDAPEDQSTDVLRAQMDALMAELRSNS